MADPIEKQLKNRPDDNDAEILREHLDQMSALFWAIDQSRDVAERVHHLSNVGQASCAILKTLLDDR